MTKNASRLNRLAIWKALLAFTLLFSAGHTTFAQDPAGNDQDDNLLVRAIVGIQLDFDLEIPSEVSNVSFQSLPDGLSFNAPEATITGIATTPGSLDTQINFQEGGQAQSMPARFEVFTESDFPGDINNPNEPQGPPEPIRIPGQVGQQLYWQVDLDLSGGYDFGPKADGTSFQLPAGIQLIAAEASFSGIPQHPGVFDFELLVVDSEGTFTERFVFEIADSNGPSDNTNPDGTVNPDGTTNPGGNDPDGDGHDDPLLVRGVVGFQLHFPLEVPDNVELQSISPLPAGLSLDLTEEAIVGTPSTAGMLDATIQVVEQGQAATHPIKFEILLESDFPGDPNDPNNQQEPNNPDEPAEPVRISGKVGESLYWQLNYNTSSTTVDYAPRPDGTTHQLPAGIDLVLAESSFIGTPQAPGVFDFALLFSPSEGNFTVHYIFDIAPATDGGDPTSPGGTPNDEQPLLINGVVGYPLHFPLEVPDEITISTFSPLPAGLTFDAVQKAIIGTPTEEGILDSLISAIEGTATDEKEVVFNIFLEEDFAGDPNNPNPRGDPTNPDGGDPTNPGQPHETLIHGKVGESLYFQLNHNLASGAYDYGTRADGTPYQLPAGIDIVAAEASFVGVPTQPGLFDFVLIISTTEGPIEDRYKFDIATDQNPNNPDPDEDKPIHIRAVVGYELLFPLEIPEDITLNTFTPFPSGLGYDTTTESVVGIPTVAGLSESLITYTEGGEAKEKDVVFEVFEEANFPGDPNNPNPKEEHHEHPINIIGDVGFPLEFHLGVDDQITDLAFDMLPEGVTFDATDVVVTGIPEQPGFFETRLRGMRDDEEIIFPVFFDIFGDWGPGPGDGGHPQEMKIFGWVGEFISFPLPYDPMNAEVALTTYADGTEAFLPIGIQLDADNGMLVGFPQEPGFFPSSFTITEGEKTEEIQVFFDIQYLDHNPGGPTTPGDPNFNHGPQEIVLFGEVDSRFAFKFPLQEEEEAELPTERDGLTFALPDGLTYNAETKSITGSPTETGVFEILVIIEGPGYVKEKFLRFMVSDGGDAPRLSFYSESEFKPGAPLSFQINASGSPTLYEVIGLPPELQLDANTGIVSGTMDREDEFDLIVIASNEDGEAYGIHYLDSEDNGPDDHNNPDDPNNPDPDNPDQPNGPDDDKEEEDPEPFFARLGVPFVLEAPEEFAEAVFAVLDDEAFPAGIGFDTSSNAVISGTPTEAGLFSTKISITRGEDVMRITLWFFVADSVEAPQFVASDFIRSRPGESFELRLPVANGPATIEIQSGPDGVSYDSETKSLRGVISDPGFYTLLVSASNDAGIGVHVIEIDVFDDGTGQNPGDNYYEPIHAFGIVGEPFDFPLPANPQNSDIEFVDGEDGETSEIPAGLEFIETYAIIRGVPEQEGVSNLYMEITEFGFTRREHIVFEIFTKDNLPDDPNFPTGPGHEEPDDGHVEPILGKVGERLYFEAPISGEGVSFEIVDGPDGEASELPPGVTFDDQVGILSGVPTAFGIYPLWIKVDEFGSIRTHFAPVIVSGVEGSPVIESDEFFTTIPGEHFKFEIKASNEPTEVEVDFFDVPGVLSFDQDSMLLEGKFDFGGFFTLLVSASNDVGTGYGLLNIDVLGLNHDGGPDNGPTDIPLHINGTVNQKVDFPLPSFIRGSKFEVTADPAGFETELPEGFTIDEKTGRISGIPTYPGFTFVWVTVDEGDLPALAINIGIAEGMRTPEIISPQFWLGHQDSPFHYQIHATDGPFRFYAENLPTGLTIDEFTGAIRGTTSESGEFEVSIAAENTAGKGEARTLYLAIEEKPRLPIVSAPFYNEGQVGEAFSLQVNATEEPDFFHAGGLPAGLSINPDTGLISGTPIHFGYFNINLEALNEWGRGSFQVAIYIKRAALAPVYTGPSNVGGKVGRAFSFQPPFNGNANEFTIDDGSPNTLPEGLTLNAETGQITGTPTSTINGFIDLTITGEGGSTIAPIYFKIVAALDAPAITNSPFAKGTSGQAFSFQLTASNNPLEFVVTNLPAGLAIDSSTGAITGTPESAGFYDIEATARNASGWGQPRLIILDIIPGLQAPVVTSAPWAKGEVGKPFAYQLSANNEPTGYTASGDLPEGLSIDETTGEISGTPTKAGFTEVILSASNASGSGNGMLFIFAIRPSQEMPVITSSGTAFAKVNEPFVYQIKAKANPTSYTAENLPDGLSLNDETGFISGTPTAPTTEPIVIIITASNVAGQSIPRAVLLEILPAAEAPVILSGGHAIGKVGVDFEFRVFATNDPTAYSSPNLPEGLSMASDTGLITGSPEKAGEFEVTLLASNDAGKGDPAQILLFIIPGADMPRVTSATHAIGKVGEDFEYQILSSTEEVNGYQVEGDLPRGLDFDPTTGLISGSPVEPIITSVYLLITNDAGTSAPQPFTIKIEPSLEAPIIVSSLRIQGTVGEEMSYTMDATNMPEDRPLPPSAEFDAIGLPSGLGINSATGIISGVPEEAGLFIATLVATNETGEGAPRFLSIKVKPAPTAPVVTSVFRVGAQVGVSFNYQIIGTNTPTSYDADHAISWLVADTETGALTGTPTKPGVYYASLFAINEAGQSDPGPLEITVYPAADTPKLTSERSADGKVGTAFEYQIEASNTPTSFAVNGLPAGLSLNPTTGVISGTPTASGTFEIVVVGSNDNGEGTQSVITLKISPKTEITIIVPGS